MAEADEMPAEQLQQEGQAPAEPESAVSEAVEALNSLRKRGLISPEQFAIALANLGEAAEEGDAGEKADIELAHAAAALGSAED